MLQYFDCSDSIIVDPTKNNSILVNSAELTDVTDVTVITSDNPHLKTYVKVNTIKTGRQLIRLEVSLPQITNEYFYNNFSLWILNPQKQSANSLINEIKVEINGVCTDLIVNPELQCHFLSNIFESTSVSLHQNNYLVIPLYGLLGKDHLLDWSNQNIVVYVDFHNALELTTNMYDSIDLFASKYYFTNNVVMLPPQGHLFYTNEFTGREEVKGKWFRMRPILYLYVIIFGVIFIVLLSKIYDYCLMEWTILI